MKRMFDIVISFGLLLLSFIPMILIYLLVRITSKGRAIYWSDRVGRGGVIFRMPKFRTMRTGAPVIATHLIIENDYLTPVGGYLRRKNLDELPQLFLILIGKMSLVGPRPALFNQYDLIELRSQSGADALLPGLTGWAQVNGRDTFSVQEKSKYDKEYLESQSLALDLKILFYTVFSDNNVKLILKL